MRSWKSITSLGVGLGLAVAACGGGGPGGPGNQPGNGATPNAGATPMRSVIVDQDSAEQTYPLEGGRYRLAWRSSDCPDGIGMVMTQHDNLPGYPPAATPYAYSKETNIPAFNTLLQRVPAGLYSFEQTVESCETWQLRVDRVGN